MKPQNLFQAIPTPLTEEWFQEIARGNHAVVERIVSQGHQSPSGFWYDQSWDEWVVVLEGRAGLEVWGQDEVVTLEKGDHLTLHAHVKHRVAWTAADRQTVWLAVHFKDTPPA
jgi:cupin 2 domain-containing protein